MLEVELRRVPEGAHEYQTVARIRVDGDRVDTWDPDDYLPLELPALVVEGGELRRVTFSEDPAVYARNLGSILRGGYLVPAVVRDDDDTGAHES